MLKKNCDKFVALHKKKIGEKRAIGARSAPN